MLHSRPVGGSSAHQPANEHVLMLPNRICPRNMIQIIIYSNSMMDVRFLTRRTLWRTMTFFRSRSLLATGRDRSGSVSGLRLQLGSRTIRCSALLQGTGTKNIQKRYRWEDLQTPVHLCTNTCSDTTLSLIGCFEFVLQGFGQKATAAIPQNIDH